MCFTVFYLTICFVLFCFFNRYSSKNVKTFGRDSTHDEVNQTAVAAERERARIEFYAAYDVMTGVRIAATLGGFFGLMVFLVIYKSRSHSSSSLKAMKVKTKKNPFNFIVFVQTQKHTREH